MSLPDKLKSPKKLERSLHNQLQRSSNSTALFNPKSHGLSISLRNINLISTLPTTLLLIKPQADLITSLDLSYSLTDNETLAAFCCRVRNLEHLHAVECRLSDISESTVWPRCLKTIDLSRNRLTMCPSGIANQLLKLIELNLSGNDIRQFEPLLLQLPHLEKLHLLNNPIRNVPKHVCRLGVCELRKFFNVEPISPQSPSSIHEHNQYRESEPQVNASCVLKSKEKSLNLRQYLLRHQGSIESGYDTESSRRPSCSTCSSASLSNDMESVDRDMELDSNVWPVFSPSQLPPGYLHSATTKHCQVYLPDDCTADIHIDIVRDMSLHPIVATNELLITSVVQVTPHGLTFNHDRPAIIVLSHCTKPNEYLRVVPLCSNTNHCQSPHWTRLDTLCEAFQNCVMFETTHFSLFAVIGELRYPTASVEINPNEGGSLVVPEMPGLEVYIPPGSLPPLTNTTTITATAYYNDHPYNIDSNDRAVASTCVELKPHGLQFTSPVQVRVPIPDYIAIKTQFPDAQLELWHSSSHNTPLNWECIQHPNVVVHEDVSDYIHVAAFTTTHFSFFEFLWTVCKYPLTKLGLGASFVFANLSNRARYISIRCQAFMSHPLSDLSFGLVVLAYKFGDPILELSNYPWLVADSGNKHNFLKIGELQVSLTGCFDANNSFGETLSREHRLMEFMGQDFCLRFEFALKLDEGVQLPLPDGKVLGKVRLTQWNGINPVHHSYNIIKPQEKVMSSSRNPQDSPSWKHQTTPASYYNHSDFTPPWSPDSDVMHMECDDNPFQSTIPISLPTDTTPSLSQSTNNHKSRKRSRFVSTSNPNGGNADAVKRQIFIRREDISDKTLMDVAQRASCKCLELGLQLGLNYSTIQNRVGSGDKGEHLKTFYVLQEWKARAADEFTFSKLAQALEEVGLNSLAQEYCYTC